MRYKKPDKKNALSILVAAEREMNFTLTLTVSEASASTIIRNIYESFRMLGDALLVAKGIKLEDHIAPIKELIKLDVSTPRSLRVLDNLRRLRHSINYYGYKPKLAEVKDFISFAHDCFEIVQGEVRRKII